MAKKDIEKELQDPKDSENLEDPKDSENLADLEAKTGGDIFPCVCGNAYDAEEWKRCPRCDRARNSTNRAGGPQDGSQNL